MEGRPQVRGRQAAPNVRPHAWDWYFTDSYEPDDRRSLLVRELVQHFASDAGWRQLLAARPWYARCLLPLDWQELVQLSGSRDLQEAMMHAPAEALGCLGCSACEVLFRLRETDTRRQLPDIQQPCKVLVRLTGLPDAPPWFRVLSALQSDSIGRLVCVRGTVVRATPPQPLVTEMQFVCGKCGSAQVVSFPEGRFTPPVSCGVEGCRSRTFEPVHSACSCVDWQRVGLQGLPKDEKNSFGRVPAPVCVELSEDLAGRLAPGEVATVVGIVRVCSGDGGGAGKKGGDPKKQCLFLPYIQAVSVEVAGKRSAEEPEEAAAAAGGGAEAGQDEGGGVLPPNMPAFTQLDLEFIRHFTEACEGDQLRQLVHSLCPSIFGQELAKAGLLLALLGGVRKPGTSDGAMALRSDLHVLLVGDPGLGKSQLLQAAAAAAPRGVYTCGNTSSAAGLTASVVRDGSEFAVDAGALVLADRGVCCIDEFDKMRSEHQALLGAMEQQEVTVAKAGLVAALPARTTVLAAANPVEGSYNRGRTLMENLKVSDAMLSRFDLVFLLLDCPDSERDKRLTAHVMALHSGLASRSAAAQQRLLGPPAGAPLLLTDGRGGGGGGVRPSLLERLQARREGDDPVPVQLLRKYIAYARQYVHPRLSDEAVEVLKEYYLQMRAAAAADQSGMPVTARQLESLVRLAEARARADLREEVSRQDAEDVVDLMQSTLEAQAAGSAATPCINFAAGGSGGRPGSQAAEGLRLLDALRRHCQAKGDAVVELWEVQDVADRVVVQVPSLQKLLAQLNEAGKLLKEAREDGDLLQKGPGRFQVRGVALGPPGHGSSLGPPPPRPSAGSKRSHPQSQQQPPPPW